MNITRRQNLMLLGSTAMLAALGLPAAAQEGGVVHEVLMLNRDPDDARETMVFIPDLLRINRGDSVRFVPADPSHNAQADPDMSPEGAEAWRARINEDITVQYDVDGAYGVICLPHRVMGMVMVVLVGDVDPAQYEAIKAVPQRGKAQARFDDIFARADELLATEGA